MKTTLYPLLLMLAVLVLSCRSAERHLLQGNYDVAFEQALQKLAKGKVSDEHALILEDAYNLALDREMSAINQLKTEQRQDRWPEIVRRYETMQYRGNRIKPFLPLYITSEGRYANLNVPDLVKPLAEARQQASQYYYTEAERFLATGLKNDAREAWSLLHRLESDYGPYLESSRLLAEAAQLGTDRVLVEWEQHPYLLPPALWDALRYTDLAPLQEPWVYYAGPEILGERAGGAAGRIQADFKVTVGVLRSQLLPPWQQELHTTESRDITIEGTRLVKDSTGNWISVPKIETITANVVQTKQLQSAVLSGWLEITDLRSGKRLFREPIEAQFVWANEAWRASGDLNALRPETKALLGGGVLPFPAPEWLMSGAVSVYSEQGLLQLRNQRQRFW